MFQNPTRIPGAGMIRRSTGMAANLQVKLLHTLTGHRQGIYALCKGDGETVYSSGGDGHIVLWHPLSQPDGLVVATVPEPVYSLTYDAANRRLFAGSHSGYWYVIENGEARNFMAHTRGLFCTLITATGYLTAGGDGRITRWSPHHDILVQVALSEKSLRDIIAIPGGYACACSDGSIYFLNRELEKTGEWRAHKLSVFAMEWLPESGRLISGGRDAMLHISGLEDANQEQTIAAHLLHIHHIQLSPGRQWLATASMDKTIKIWDADTLELLKVMDAAKFGLHKASVNRLTWLSEHVLISASDDRCLGVWEIGLI